MSRIWKPSPGPQERFHRSPAFEVLYGGQAGGGKTESLLVEALRYVDVPGYNAILFRRTFPELQQPEGLIERSYRLCPILQGKYHETKLRWRFPSGAILVFRHMERDADRLKHQSAEYAYIGFDELTTFTEAQYRYLFSRARTTCGVPPRVRAGTNPGGIGHEWVKRRWGPWLDGRHPQPATNGEVRWFRPENGAEVECAPGDPEGLARTFIKSTVWDNPYLIKKDPGYIARLKALPLVERMQLLEGDWDIMAGAGTVIKRDWFEIVEAAPAEAQRVRFWDLAATEKETAKEDPDFTACARVSKADKVYYIEQVLRAQRSWAAVKRWIGQMAELDGQEMRIGVEQEPGASGVAVIHEICQHPTLQGKFAVKGYRPIKDKVMRANVWASQAQVGNVKVVNDGTWDVEAFLNECQMFPEGVHDDQVDAVSGAVHMLERGGPLVAFG